MVTVLPEGEAQGVQLKHVVVGKQDAEITHLRAIVTGADTAVPQGTYAQLFISGQGLVMSDTAMEHRSNREFLWHARGRVLIAGLGLGMIVLPASQIPRVESITVVEKYGGVIELVEPPLRKAMGGREGILQVVHADIFTWKPPKGATWDVIYFDIWPTICTDNIPWIVRLHRRFARRKAPGGWMGSWNYEYLKYQRSRERRMGW
jgi:hypothetical protein